MGHAVIDISEAKRKLARIVEQAAAGADIIIARAGKPMVKLVPIAAVRKPKELGLLRGRITVPDDFNAPLDCEVMADYQGRQS